MNKKPKLADLQLFVLNMNEFYPELTVPEGYTDDENNHWGGFIDFKFFVYQDEIELRICYSPQTWILSVKGKAFIAYHYDNVVDVFNQFDQALTEYYG